MYAALLAAAEENLKKYTTLSPAEFSRAAQAYEVKGKEFIETDDDEMYRKLVEVTFYSGFKAETVTQALPTIHRHFNDFRKVATYGAADIEAILKDPGMIAHPAKVKACVKNAARFVEILKGHTSIAAFFNQDGPFGLANDFNLKVLRDNLIKRFSYLGGITVYHYMMELGLHVLKPDRVICRIFHRLGLATDPIIVKPDAASTAKEKEQYLWDIVCVGREIAKTSGRDIRYVDIVFIGNGQVEVSPLGMRGICLEKNPSCNTCLLQSHCRHNENRQCNVG